MRTTTNLDLLVEFSEPEYASIRAHLDADGWEVRPAGGERLEFPDIVRLRHAAHFPTDFLLAKTDYQQVAIARARLLEAPVLGVAVPYLSPEDVVVHKLIAYRFRDRDDLESLVRAGVALDAEYVAHWCDEWGIRERWDELLRGT